MSSPTTALAMPTIRAASRNFPGRPAGFVQRNDFEHDKHSAYSKQQDHRCCNRAHHSAQAAAGSVHSWLVHCTLRIKSIFSGRSKQYAARLRPGLAMPL